ncbi:hypothetical protein AC249_AIPGENE38, partial [Exaiptasia diaphana]
VEEAQPTSNVDRTDNDDSKYRGDAQPPDFYNDGSEYLGDATSDLDNDVLDNRETHIDLVPSSDDEMDNLTGTPDVSPFWLRLSNEGEDDHVSASLHSALRIELLLADAGQSSCKHGQANGGVCVLRCLSEALHDSDPESQHIELYLAIVGQVCCEGTACGSC